MINKLSIAEVFMFVLIMSLFKSIVMAEPKLDTRTDIYWKLCSVFKFSKFCLPYYWGAYSYPLLPIPGAVLPIVPFPPLVVNPTTSLPFTIPTIFTTPNRSPTPPVPQIPPGPPQNIPNQPPFPNPSGGCPPGISICPPAALSGPIDPRQGIYLNSDI